jgi:hypothetical protein
LTTTFAESIIDFFNSLPTSHAIPGIDIINPYQSEEVKSVVGKFYSKYFNDFTPRTFILGINPGRFGGGLTGVSFTDPLALKEFCGIENDLGHQKELSSRFIYSMITAYGGPQSFYSKFYLTALFPLAIVRDGKNYNYYDTPLLVDQLKPSIIASLKDQIKCGAIKERAICLGKKNFQEMKKINDKYNFFNHLEVLEHPRYIMQYKLKKLPEYIDNYLKVLDRV